MKPEQIVAVAARLLAIALILTTVRELVSALWVVNDAITLRKYGYIFLVSGLAIFISILLWKFPLTIAKKIFPFKSDDEPKHNFNSDDFYHLGFILLGTYLLF